MADIEIQTAYGDGSITTDNPFVTDAPQAATAPDSIPTISEEAPEVFEKQTPETETLASESPESNVSDAQQVSEPLLPTSSPLPEANELGLLSGASISVVGGNTVRVVLPARGGANNITEISVPIAAAWLIHCAVDPAFKSAEALLLRPISSIISRSTAAMPFSHASRSSKPFDQ